MVIKKREGEKAAPQKPPPKTISGSQSGKCAALPLPTTAISPTPEFLEPFARRIPGHLAACLILLLTISLSKKGRRQVIMLGTSWFLVKNLRSQESNQTMGGFPVLDFYFITRALMSNCLEKRNLQGFCVRKHGSGFWYKKLFCFSLQGWGNLKQYLFHPFSIKGVLEVSTLLMSTTQWDRKERKAVWAGATHCKCSFDTFYLCNCGPASVFSSVK